MGSDAAKEFAVTCKTVASANKGGPCRVDDAAEQEKLDCARHTEECRIARIVEIDQARDHLVDEFPAESGYRFLNRVEIFVEGGTRDVGLADDGVDGRRSFLEVPGIDMHQRLEQTCAHALAALARHADPVVG